MINLSTKNKQTCINNIVKHALKRKITTFKELHFLVIERCSIYKIKRSDTLKVIYTIAKNKLLKLGLKLVRVSTMVFKSAYQKVRYYAQKPIIDKTSRKLEQLGDFNVLEFLRTRQKNATFWGLYYLKKYYGLAISWAWFKDVFNHSKVVS